MEDEDSKESRKTFTILCSENYTIKQIKVGIEQKPRSELDTTKELTDTNSGTTICRKNAKTDHKQTYPKGTDYRSNLFCKPSGYHGIEKKSVKTHCVRKNWTEVLWTERAKCQTWKNWCKCEIEWIGQIIKKEWVR